MGRRDDDDAIVSDNQVWRKEVFLIYGESISELMYLADEIASELSSPREAVGDFKAFVEQGGRPGTDLRSFTADLIALDLLLRLSSTSQFGFGICMRWPGVFWEVVQHREFRQIWGRAVMRRARGRASPGPTTRTTGSIASCASSSDNCCASCSGTSPAT